jgi:hypothetical protein
MSASGSTPGSGNKPKALAFYLPQYHPIPENDEWWGTGFTEWHNVTKARPLFPGHYQPHVPGELGYYDLRLPEVRAAQAKLAREHGIYGFIYYHYWFQGHRLLERPFEEVLASGEPDFPFALCWANEEWTRGWDGRSGHVLMRQEFSEEDDRAHIRDLIRAFKDPRYITIDGRPLMLIYRPALLLDCKRTSAIWREEVQRAGFPDIYLCWVESWGPPPGNAGPTPYGLDASVGFMPLQGEDVHAPLETLRGHRVVDYQSAVEAEIKHLERPWKRFPSVMVGWDNTARRARGATIYQGVTPARYEQWLQITADLVADVRPEENYLFILAWNEWAEGNHLEPDKRYGRAFLEATRAVLGETLAQTDSPALLPRQSTRGASEGSPDVPTWPHRSEIGEVVANVGSLLAELELPVGRQVVSFQDQVAVSEGPVIQPLGADVVTGTFTDVASLKSTLDGADDIGAVLLVDVLQHLVDPQELLATLSTWSLDHGSPPLVVTVPHVAHVDMALHLLCGRFDVTQGGLLDPVNLRFFTEEALQSLLERSGWRLVGRADLHSLYSDQYEADLRNGLPEEMVGALQAAAEAVNPNWSVTHFVWALEPQAVEMAPTSYLEAVSPAEPPPSGISREAAETVATYLASVGLVVSETNRRAVIAARNPSMGSSAHSLKQYILGFAYGSPRRAAIFMRLYRRLGGRNY